MCNSSGPKLRRFPLKKTIAHTPSLRIPYFEKDFIIYTFPSYNSLAVVLTQKGELGEEYLISFMRTGLQGVELNYPVLDKQTYAMFKVIKQFRPYILRSRTKVIVPHPVVRSLFV